MVKYTAMLACGNYHGVVGFAKAKGPAVPIALQKVSCGSLFVEIIVGSMGAHLWLTNSFYK